MSQVAVTNVNTFTLAIWIVQVQLNNCASADSFWCQVKAAGNSLQLYLKQCFTRVQMFAFPQSHVYSGCTYFTSLVFLPSGGCIPEGAHTVLFSILFTHQPCEEGSQAEVDTSVQVLFLNTSPICHSLSFSGKLKLNSLLLQELYYQYYIAARTHFCNTAMSIVCFIIQLFYLPNNQHWERLKNTKYCIFIYIASQWSLIMWLWS